LTLFNTLGLLFVECKVNKVKKFYIILNIESSNFILNTQKTFVL